MGKPKDVVIAYCEANPDFAIGVVEGVVKMVPYDAQDSSQHWTRYVPSEADQQNKSSYYIVHNATQKVLTAGPGTLAAHLSVDSDINPENMLWTPAQNITDSYGSFTITQTPSLNVTVAGNVEEGSRLVVVPWGNASNQRWKFIPLPLVFN